MTGSILIGRRAGHHDATAATSRSVPKRAILNTGCAGIQLEQHTSRQPRHGILARETDDDADEAFFTAFFGPVLKIGP